MTVTPSTAKVSGGGVTAVNASLGTYTSSQSNGTVTVSNSINVFNAVSGTIGLTPTCDHAFGYAAAGSGGEAPYTYAFTVQTQNAQGGWDNACTFNRADSLASPGVSGSIDVSGSANNPTGCATLAPPSGVTVKKVVGVDP